MGLGNGDFGVCACECVSRGAGGELDSLFGFNATLQLAAALSAALRSSSSCGEVCVHARLRSAACVCLTGGPDSWPNYTFSNERRVGPGSAETGQDGEGQCQERRSRRFCGLRSGGDKRASKKVPGGETCEEDLHVEWSVDKHRGTSGASLAERV